MIAPTVVNRVDAVEIFRGGAARSNASIKPPCLRSCPQLLNVKDDRDVEDVKKMITREDNS